MYLHVGNKKIVSDNNTIGIFNIEVLCESDCNAYYIKDLKPVDKTLIVFSNNSYITTNISPYTLIKRKINNNDVIWSKENAKKI